MSSELAIEGQNRGFSQRVRSEAFPANHIHGDFIYRRIRVNRRNSLLVRLKAIPFENQMGYDALRTPNEVRHNIREGGEVTFVMPARGKDMGKEIAIATREMRRGVLVTGVVVVNEDYRRKGIATHLAEDAVLRLKPVAVTGRTRDWRVYRTYERLEYQGERVLPIIAPIDTDRRLPEEARRRLVVVLTSEERKKLNLERGLYPEGTYPRLIDKKKFPIPRNDPAGFRIYSILKEMGIDPSNPEDRGRGTRYDALTEQEVVDSASAKYNPKEVVILPTPFIDRLIAALSGIVFIPPSFKRA